MTDNLSFQGLRTKLYIDLLLSISLEDASMQDTLLDITLGSLVHELGEIGSGVVSGQAQENFNVEALLTYGTPARHYLSHSTQRRLLDEVQKIIYSIAVLFHRETASDSEDTEKTGHLQLDEAIQLCKDEIESLKEQIRTISTRLMDLMIGIAKNRGDLDQELNHAKTTVFPLHDAARMASIDLLAATIEASLVKLSLTKARTERALYDHGSNPKSSGERQTVAQAIATAQATWKRDEKNLKAERESLDHQLREYETLLQMVDGGKAGYQQVIDDWTKVQQETDECLKDLRRLGWTGD